MAILLGVIEGFYGKPWSWQERIGYISFLKENGLNFYIYAPKEDRFLREDWKTSFPGERLSKLNQLGKSFREAGLKWGIGFSPFNAYKSFNTHTKSILKKKLEEIFNLKPDILAILFDDMEGDVNKIAETQVEITHYIAEYFSALSHDKNYTGRVLFCPTYYSYDPILEKVFGNSPAGYLEYIGKNLNSEIDIIWTGPMVRSESITVEHLREVEEILGRKPFIWDNYIANDGEKHKNHIYLKPFRGRKSEILNFISGYMINPMNQAELSKIPILTAVEIFKSGNKYQPEPALKRAIQKVCGEQYAPIVEKYTKYLIEGKHNIPPTIENEMIERISTLKGEWAVEITQWLKE